MSLPKAPPDALWVGVVDAGGERGAPHVVAVCGHGRVLRYVGAWVWTPGAPSISAHVVAVADMARGIAARDAEIAALKQELRETLRELRELAKRSSVG